MNRGLKLFAHLEKAKHTWFLLAISAFFFLLRLPSLFEPYWYGDEGIYQTIGIAMQHGSLLYRDIWDNKPPLLYVIYALFSGDQFTIRLVSIFFGIGCCILFFFLSKKISSYLDGQRHETSSYRNLYIGTFVFTLFFGIPLLEGNIANAENFMLFFTLSACLFVFRYLETGRKNALWYAGFFVGITAMFKIVGIFDFAAIGIFLFATIYKKHHPLFLQIKTLLAYLYGFLIPLGITILYFLLVGALPFFLSAVFSQNVDYVGYGNHFFIPQGLLYIKVLCLFVGTSLLVYKRASFSKGQLFIYLWILFSLFNAFFSQRPYTHYLLVLLPSLCLFIFLTLQNFSQKVSIRKHAISFGYSHICILLTILLLIWNNFIIYKKTLPYYQNFFSFISGTISLTRYQQFFDSSMPDMYAIAQFLRIHNKEYDSMLLWGDGAQLYKLSETLPPGRLTVAYHITSTKERVQETAQAIARKKPRFIVIMSRTTFPFDLSRYRYVYSVANNHIYEYRF